MFEQFLKSFFWFLASFFRARSDLAIENMALRQQLAILKDNNPRPKLKNSDRFFCMILSRFWKNWKDSLVIVRPETVIRWHRKGYKFYWSRRVMPRGRPRIDFQVQQLIQQMAKENGRGVSRIHGELLKLGIEVGETTILRYLPKDLEPPKQTWKNFIKNHLHETVAIDFFSVPTITFRRAWVLIVLSHERRKIEHFAVTMNPDKVWIKQHLRNAFPGDHDFKYLIRDNHAKFWKGIEHFVEYLGLKDIPIAKVRPWQNGYCERVIGTIKRELADKIIVISVKQLYRLLSEYVDYYNNDRTHLGIGKDSPCGRVTEFGSGKIKSKQVAGGFYHRYYRGIDAA